MPRLQFSADADRKSTTNNATLPHFNNSSQSEATDISRIIIAKPARITFCCTPYLIFLGTMQPSPPARAPRIAIIGAGPAGATLARLLQSFSSSSPIDVTVFEGETSLSVRAQGGTLDLHTSTGQRALRECGLYEDFLRYARFDGEAMTVCDGVVEERGGVLLRIGG